MVRRTRAYRERAARRRRQAIALGAGVCLSLGLGTAFSVASFAGGDLAEAAVSRAKSLMDLMDQRSPGERTAAELTKTKRKSSSILAEEDAPESPKPEVPKNLADVIAPPASALVPVSTAVPPTTLELPQPPGSVLIPPPGGGVITPPGGGDGTPPGGGGGTPPGGGGGTPPGGGGTPPPALPEPGTWMTMILGLGFAGWSLRRSRAAQPLSKRA